MLLVLLIKGSVSAAVAGSWTVKAALTRGTVPSGLLLLLLYIPALPLACGTSPGRTLLAVVFELISMGRGLKAFRLTRLLPAVS
jgi:hypothetical protein